MSRRHGLSDEDEALWTSVTRSIKPLRTKAPQPKPRTAPLRAGSKAAPLPPAVPAMREAAPAKSPPLAPFDRRLKQRVARGREGIDARIDLHGMTQSEAYAALLRFLRRAQADGGRIALIVTGKGSPRSAGGSSERGVLKRQVPLWLALPELRPLIVGFEDAHVSHGGQGALYVRLRRIRDYNG
jgi:DNA-nicking Smr family endonuclease